MNHVIIGSGPAGVTAAEEIRRLDPAAEITLLSHEPEPPYARMAIPYLIKNQIGESGTFIRKSDTHFEDLNIGLLEAEIESIDTAGKILSLRGGEFLAYDKLLIASGGTPLIPPIEGIDLPGVTPCWTLDNARRIIERAVADAHIVLIGAGFISTTIVEALVERGGSLTIVEMEDRLIPRMMDSQGADIIRKWCEARGVTIKTSARVDHISHAGERLTVSIAGQDSIEADLVISATGVAPNIGFLGGSGLDTDMGILVDEYLTTSHPDIYAAGDVAQAPDMLSGGKTVMAVQPVAAEHGRLAGTNMVKGNALAWIGSINMNVLDMLGLVSCSFGLWDGVDSGDYAELYKPEQNKYIKLQFEADRLVGASSVGYTDHVGVFQGLIMGKVSLGNWKEKLMKDPTQIMNAWIGSTQGTT